MFCAGTRDSRVASYWIDTLVLKNYGNTYATFLHHPFLFGENQRSAQEVARRISRAVAGEVYAKVNIPSTQHIPLSPALHYFPFASRFPLPHFTLAVLFALSFSFPFSFSVCLFLACLLFARVLDCLFVAMAQDNTKLCDFTNTNNNDFLSTLIAPLLLMMLSLAKSILLC